MDYLSMNPTRLPKNYKLRYKSKLLSFLKASKQ